MWNKGNREKKPIIKLKPGVLKQPVSAPEKLRDKYKKHPTWSLSGLDRNGRWGFGTLDGESLGCVMGHVIDASTQVWPEIRRASDYYHHSPKDKFCKDARDRLYAIGLDDLDGLSRFRFAGKQRLWGVERDGVFHIIWWDPDHEVYPTKKRNT